MKIVADPGSYYFRSPGEPESAATCGMYVVAPANAVVLVEMEAVEVTCGEGLVVVRRKEKKMELYGDSACKDVPYVPRNYVVLSGGKV